MADMQKMTDEKLVQVIKADLDTAIGKAGSKQAIDRQSALEAYLGEPKGDFAPPEAEGRSKVVSMDVADTIESVLPALIKIFTAGDDAVEFQAQSEEDIAAAEQMTQWANYVFYRQNPGFLILHNWFKDALLFRLGVVKVWWDQDKDVTTEEYEGLTAIQLTMMMQDGDVQITEQSSYMPEEQTQGQTALTPPEPLYDVTVKRTKDTSQICIANVPPEEFLYSRKATGPHNLYFAHHRVLKTMSELKASGYDNVDKIGGDDSSPDFSEERVERKQRTDEFTYSTDTDSSDSSMKRVWIVESYGQIDFDGDGIAEWRKVVTCGKTLLANEEVDDHAFCLLSPILMPHEVAGRSITDQTLDLQKIKTALWRQGLDNLYIGNNLTTVIDETAGVNIDDVLDRRVGGVIRTRNIDGVRNLELPANFAPSLTGLEYADSVKENRTGVTRYNQGTDANSLNKTASGINSIMNASQQRQELIARIFAETGVKDLFRKIQRLSAEYQKKQQIIRLNNKFIPVDPRAWKTQYDMTINVGLGTGNKDQMAAHLMSLMQIQEKAVQVGVATPKNIYNAATKFAQNVGFKDGDSYFTDPTAPPDPKAPPPAPPPPDPKMVKVQQDGQLAQQKLQAEQQQHQMEMQQNQQQMQAEAQLEIIKAHLDQQTQMMELKMNATLEVILQHLKNQGAIEAAEVAAKANDGQQNLDYERSQA